MMKEESTYKMPKNCLTFPTTIKGVAVGNGSKAISVTA